MVLSLLAVVAVVAVASAVLGSLAVYLDARRRDEDYPLLWTGVTGLGFVFGVLPGLALMLAYFIVSRKF